MKRFFLLLSVVLISSGPALAGGHHGCCADCGCKHGLRKVCRWECEEVEEKVPAWDCECEDIVIPGKSPYCIQEQCPDPCQNCASRGHPRPHHKKLWGPPRDCCVKTVKALVPIEKTVKKKVLKPVIETVCDTCCAASGCGPGGCVDGAVPALDQTPMSDPTIAPPADSRAPLPPMPPVPADRETSSRRGLNPMASFFNVVSKKR